MFAVFFDGFFDICASTTFALGINRNGIAVGLTKTHYMIHRQNTNRKKPWQVYNERTMNTPLKIKEQPLPINQLKDTMIAKQDECLNRYKLVVVAVATDPNHPGLRRFVHSCQVAKVDYRIIGLNTPWIGGDMDHGPGGGQKVLLLREELGKWTRDCLDNTLLLFMDSYDVVVVGGETEIVAKYMVSASASACANPILFSAEKSCWPRRNLAKHYPSVDSPYRYLNSGGYIGKARDIYDLISANPIGPTDDDQLYFTYAFFSWRSKIQLDYRCAMFQTLNDAMDDVVILQNRPYNRLHSTWPIMIHGNGPKKDNLDRFYAPRFLYKGNYVF